MTAIQGFWAEHGAQITAIAQAVWGAISLLVESVMGVIAGIITTVLAIITGDWEGAWNGLKGIVESIMKWFGGLGQAFMDIGKNIIDGIINGIKAKATGAVDAVKNIAKNMADAFKSFWGINSPATLGIEFGGYIPEGVAIGVKDKAVKVQQATQQMSNMAGSGMSTQGATRQTAGAGGGFNFSPQITVNVNGGGTVKESFSSIEQQLNLFMDEYAQKMALRNPKIAY
jgi:phage-related protein